MKVSYLTGEDDKNYESDININNSMFSVSEYFEIIGD